MTHPTKQGFTLIEILVVIAIMSILLAIAIPLASTFSPSGKINSSIVEVGGLFEQARQYAVSQNTYVWIAFNEAGDSPESELTVAIISSKDGTNSNTNPQNAQDFGPVPSETLDLISKIKTFKGIQVKNLGDYETSQFPNLPQHPGQGTGFSENARFLIKMPGATSPTLFNRSIQFNPGGGIRNNDAPIEFLEFSLQPLQVDARKSELLMVVVRVNGLTGQTTFYRR